MLSMSVSEKIESHRILKEKETHLILKKERANPNWLLIVKSTAPGNPRALVAKLSCCAEYSAEKVLKSAQRKAPSKLR